MENKDLDIPTQKDVIKIPKDESANAVIIDLNIKTWLDITKDVEKIKKLNDPSGKVLEIKYDSNGIVRQDIFPLADKITTASKYGRLLIKYNIDDDKDFKPIIGMPIKVFFDGEGRSNIIIAK